MANRCSPTTTIILLQMFLFLGFLAHCASRPSLLPPSESDLNILGMAKLCQTKSEAQSSWLTMGGSDSSWGIGKEIFQEISSPTKQGQWFMFNEDQILVGVITVFPNGLSLNDYPKLRHTLSQLSPAREFFFQSSQLLKGQAPDSVTLYRTGETTTTHQYFIRHPPNQKDHLVMAVFVLDPYEQLLDGSHQKFLSYIEKPDFSQKGHVKNPNNIEFQEGFLGLQQFARGEIALFGSCGNKQPNIALDAYQKAIHYGLPDTKQLAEAHHRLGLTLRNVGRVQEAKTALEEALTIQPHAAGILNSYGSILAQLGEMSKAIEIYEQALALRPDYAHARFNLAEAYERLDPKRAIQEYETFLFLAEDKPEESQKIHLAKDKIKALQGGLSR
jgi:tetratricopeptide (TPR) repeat protein